MRFYSYGPSQMMAGYGFGILGFLMMIVLWALVIGVIVVIIVWLTRAGRPHPENTGAAPGAPVPGQPDPLETARHRLARGEITPEQFDEICKRLTATASAPPQPPAPQG